MKTLIFIPFIFTTSCYALDPSDALLKAAKIKGDAVYTTCVLNPPTDPTSKSTCASLYAVYNKTLDAVAAPSPKSTNPTPSMTSWSEYDPCRYDAAAFVYANPASMPYCPSI